jgi:hypothetical protein
VKSRFFLLIGLLLAIAIAFFYFTRSKQVRAEVNIYASPVQGGCYISAPNDCRLHVDPFTINLTPGSKLVFFQLVAINTGNGTQRVIYDFRPDQSNPVPPSGSTYSPSLVAQDFAATCGEKYEISLQGQDSFDNNPFNLGLTTEITCPSSAP